MEKPIEPRHEGLVRESRAERERLLKELDKATRETVPELLRAIAEQEAILLRRDPNFVAPPRRLSFLQPVDAAILLLMESGNESILESTLIDMMLAHGVCLGNSRPRADIARSFGRMSVRKRLNFDKATGRVSIAKAEQQVRKKK
jgi:hypothetical protein